MSESLCFTSVEWSVTICLPIFLREAMLIGRNARNFSILLDTMAPLHGLLCLCQCKGSKDKFHLTLHLENLISLSEVFCSLDLLCLIFIRRFDVKDFSSSRPAISDAAERERERDRERLKDRYLLHSELLKNLWKLYSHL